MIKLNICIDIDGTITSPYHFIPYLNAYDNLYNLAAIRHRITKEDVKQVLETVGLGDTGRKKVAKFSLGMRQRLAIAQAMNTMISEFHEKYMHSYGEAKVVDDAKNIIDELKKNHNLYFVTARDAKLTDITKNWLNENGFEEIDVYLLGSDYKIQKAKELECHIFIEDNPSNAMQLANEGMKVLLIDTNYNKEIEHENIVRVNNWIDIHGFIQEYN